MNNNDDLALKLKVRYSEPETPKCRICGAEMSIQRAGGGSLVYGCDGRVEGDGYAFKDGRSFADKHYEQSRETVYNLGDSDVIALLAERTTDKAENASLRQRVVELEDLLEKSQSQSSKWLEAYHKAVSIGARYEERIAELEARTVSVKLPEPLMPAQHTSGELFMTPDNIEQGGYLNRDDVLRAWHKAGSGE